MPTTKTTSQPVMQQRLVHKFQLNKMPRLFDDQGNRLPPKDVQQPGQPNIIMINADDDWMPKDPIEKLLVTTKLAGAMARNLTGDGELQGWSFQYIGEQMLMPRS